MIPPRRMPSRPRAVVRGVPQLPAIAPPSARDLSPHALMVELWGRVCAACGQPKQSRHTFCGLCYRRLPKSSKAALYHPMGAGYEESYRAAYVHLVRRSEP